MCGTSIMGLMMLGAAMGDTIVIHARGRRRRRGAGEQLVELVERPLRRGVSRAARKSLLSPTRPSSGCAGCATRRSGGPRGCSWPRACGSWPRRGTAACCRDDRLLRQGGASPAGRRDHRRGGGRGRRGDRDQPRHPRQDERQGQSASAARRLCQQPRPTLAGIDRAAAPLWLVAQALRDPGNIGTILRTGDAVGAGGLILIDDSADPFSVEAVRASMGAIFTQQVGKRQMGRIPAVAARRAGANGGHQPQYRHRLSRRQLSAPCFLLIGNESQGLPADYEAAATCW